MVSVVIPTRNRADFLPLALRSVLAQTYRDWECLVIDDHSTDGTAERWECLSGGDDRMRLLRLDQATGANAARNAGFRASRGSHFLFLDSDDALAPSCLDHRMRTLASRPALDFGVWTTRLFQREPGDSELLWNVPTSEDDLTRFLLLDVPWQTAGVLWTRRALERLGGWREDLPDWQDWDFHLRALSLGLRYERFGETDCFWRTPRADSLWHRIYDPSTLEPRLRLLESTVRVLRDAGKLETCRRDLLAGLFFWLACRCIQQGASRWRALAIWQRARKADVISQARFYFGCQRLCRGKASGRASRRVFADWPAAFHTGESPTFHKISLPPPPPSPSIASICA